MVDSLERAHLTPTSVSAPRQAPAFDEASGETEAKAVRAILRGSSTSVSGWAGIHTATHEQLVERLQRMHGNAFVQRFIAQSRQTSTTAPPQSAIQRQIGQVATRTPTSPLLPAIWDRLASWVKQHPQGKSDVSRNPVLRDVLLSLYARIGASLWKHIGQITWVGEHGEMNFIPADEGALLADLIGRGYTALYFAGLGYRWGLRELGLDAAGLHWRGKEEGIVEVHIDLHPPSFTGLWHLIQDGWRRSTTHTSEAIKAGIMKIVPYIPVLHEQKFHGELTVRLSQIAEKSKDQPDALAAIARGRKYLEEASQTIWTKNVVSQPQLDSVITLLVQADLEASLAERLLQKGGEIPPTAKAPSPRDAGVPAGM